jgi:predicted RNase H-like HicB family nuclease
VGGGGEAENLRCEGRGPNSETGLLSEFERASAGDIMDAMTHLTIIVERHVDGYIAYPVGLKGVVIGQGDSYEEALDDVRSAIRFHIATFGGLS